MDIKLIKKGDIIVALCLAAVCLAAMCAGFFSKGGLKAVITVNGEVFSVVDLGEVNEGYIIELPTEPAAAVLVEHNSICFVRSQCPDKLCERAGKLTKKGTAAVCLPAKAVISVEGSGGVDAVTY